MDIARDEAEDAFDAILNSARQGVDKGDADVGGQSRFFLPYLEANDVAPGESVLIDDSPQLAPVMAATGIEFLYAPFGAGPCAHLRALLAAASQAVSREPLPLPSRGGGGDLAGAFRGRRRASAQGHPTPTGIYETS